jgi:RNA recognition motif-containing protein
MFKIFVGNLSFTTTDQAVRDLFSRYFTVEDCVMAIDPKTNKPRGFAIVMTRDDVKARAALESMRGVRLDGRLLIVNEARGKGKKGAPGSGPGGPRGPRGPRSGVPSGISHRPRGRSFRASDRPSSGGGGGGRGGSGGGGGGYRGGGGGPRRFDDRPPGGGGPRPSGPQQPPPPPSRG